MSAAEAAMKLSTPILSEYSGDERLALAGRLVTDDLAGEDRDVLDSLSSGEVAFLLGCWHAKQMIQGHYLYDSNLLDVINGLLRENMAVR